MNALLPWLWPHFIKNAMQYCSKRVVVLICGWHHAGQF